MLEDLRCYAALVSAVRRPGTAPPHRRHLMWRGPIFHNESREYRARIRHGSGVINFGRARFAAFVVAPDTALKQIAPMMSLTRFTPRILDKTGVRTVSRVAASASRSR
jgi:hypothetical protein